MLLPCTALAATVHMVKKTHYNAWKTLTQDIDSNHL